MNSRPTLLPSALLSSRLLGSASARPPAPGILAAASLGDPGRTADVPTLVIAIFDNSGSVVSSSGTDPLSNRFGEVDAAFSLVARKGSRRELGAVLHFDTPTSADVAPVPITRRGLVRLRTGLRVPPDGAGTSQLAPSLRRAEEIAEAYPDHATTLVVLSDFLLLDTDPKRVLAALALFPGAVHAVVLGAHVAKDIFDTRITVTPIAQSDPPGAVARALFASLITHRPGSYVHSPP